MAKKNTDKTKELQAEYRRLAKRLATREIGSRVFLVEIVKEYKSRLEIDEL